MFGGKAILSFDLLKLLSYVFNHQIEIIQDRKRVVEKKLNKNIHNDK